MTRIVQQLAPVSRIGRMYTLGLSLRRTVGPHALIDMQLLAAMVLAKHSSIVVVPSSLLPTPTREGEREGDERARAHTIAAHACSRP
jgi:hypothetical protein